MNNPMTPQELPELLPLPEPLPNGPVVGRDGAGWEIYGDNGGEYTADQMHQYARDCIAALAGAGAVAVGYIWPDAIDELRRWREEGNKGGNVYLWAQPTGQAGLPVFTHPAPVAVGVDEAMTRPTFDKWIVRRHGYGTDRWADSGQYRYQNTRDFWECWKLALTAALEAKK